MVERLSQLISDINTKAIQDTVSTSELFTALQSLLQLGQSSHIDTSHIVATATLSSLNALLTSKAILLTYSLQTLLVMVFECIFTRNTPGYVIRNIIASLINVCQQKVSTIGARECAITLLGIVTERRTSESLSFTQEILNLALKFTRSSDIMLRHVSTMSIVSMVKGYGSSFVENYSEITKYIPKLCSDRAPEIRISSCQLIFEISTNLHLCPDKFIEAFIPTLIKGLDDGLPNVQDKFASTLSYVSYSLIFKHHIKLPPSNTGFLSAYHGIRSAASEIEDRSCKGDRF